MTKEYVPLHGLRAMATAFFLVRIDEGKTYCADLHNKIVDYKNCDGNL